MEPLAHVKQLTLVKSREKYKSMYNELYLSGIVQEQCPQLILTVMFLLFNGPFTSIAAHEFINRF